VIRVARHLDLDARASLGGQAGPGDRVLDPLD
jgi:hypothetical protein